MMNFHRNQLDKQNQNETDQLNNKKIIPNTYKQNQKILFFPGKLLASFPNVSVAASELFKAITSYCQGFQDHSDSSNTRVVSAQYLPHMLLVPGERRKRRQT